MPLTTQSLNLFNNQSMPIVNQAGVNFLPQFAAPYKEGVSYTKRVPNCQKCGQHGRKSRLKGHKRVCPFKDCNCAKCQVVTERQKLMADQIKIRRRQRKTTIEALTRDNLNVLNAVTVAAVANPQPYINNLNNLNILCKQIVAQQPGTTDAQQDLENQQPARMNANTNSTSPTTSMTPFQVPSSQILNTNTSNVLSPTIKPDSPRLVSSPLSTIGTEMSLSPQQFSRANSFDLGMLKNQVGIGSLGSAPQQQLFSAALTQPLMKLDLKPQVASTSSNVNFELTPLESVGLAAPIPLNPTQNTSTLNYDNLLALTQLLTPQQPIASTPAAPSLMQFVTSQPQQPANNLQDLLSLLTMLQQFQGQQLGPPLTDKSPHNPNTGFVDVCSV